jgi:hypothetical protein
MKTQLLSLLSLFALAPVLVHSVIVPGADTPSFYLVSSSQTSAANLLVSSIISFPHYFLMTRQHSHFVQQAGREATRPLLAVVPLECSISWAVSSPLPPRPRQLPLKGR